MRCFFNFRMDSIKQFMEHHNVPYALQTRVKKWAHYAWSRCVTSPRQSYQKITFDKALVANATKKSIVIDKILTSGRISFIEHKLINTQKIVHIWKILKKKIICKKNGDQRLRSGDQNFGISRQLPCYQKKKINFEPF